MLTKKLEKRNIQEGIIKNLKLRLKKDSNRNLFYLSGKT